MHYAQPPPTTTTASANDTVMVIEHECDARMQSASRRAPHDGRRCSSLNRFLTIAKMRSQDAEFGLMQKTMLAAIVHAGMEPPYCTPPVEDRVRVAPIPNSCQRSQHWRPTARYCGSCCLRPGRRPKKSSGMMSDPQCRSDTLGSGSEWVDGRWILILQ